ncbi:aminoglycoside phosphotransferase [Bacillus shackletonii]|uniref:aminoglycoside phosphotransferase n=1 Tax=Margalitia sp. FSL K6-0131 TaxID=2954604 RepID=UPI0009F82708|nr:aminoglycoside phosphotransferase [Heyndrickxia shackletonii]NEZ01418.1 aminoglycoside phosphotransferase [Heyndrickxia shackletonii]
MVVPIYSAVEFSFSGNSNIKDYTQSIAESLFEGYLEEFHIPQEMITTLPLLFKLKELFEYNVMHMYWNAEKLTEEQVRILNHYRLRLENNYSPINLGYERLAALVSQGHSTIKN